MSSSLGGGGANKQTQAYQNQQAQMAAQQQQMYKDVAPEYMKGLDFLSNYAGLGNFHPSDFGSQAPAPGMPPMADPSQQPHNTQLGGYYNPPPQQSGAWNWSAPGQQTMAPSATIPQSKDDKTRDLILGGQGDGPAQLGPNPYPTSTPTQPNAPAAPTPSAVTPPPRPQSNMQQYMQATPGMRPFNASAGSIGNHQSEGAYNANPSAASTQGSMGPSPYTSGPPVSGGVSNSQMGIFNDPADALRNAQAQDDINHQQYLQQQQMKAQLGSRGLEDSSVLGGGLQQLSQNALQNYAGYRRNLAMNAGQEQANRVAQMMGALNPGFSSGQQSASNYGGLTQQSFQQQQASQNALQQLFGSIGSYLGMGGLGGLGGGYSNPMATYNQSGMSNIG